MNILEKMGPHLKSLRLSGILETVQLRNQQAIEQKLSYLEFLGLVFSDEHLRRENKKMNQRMRKANFEPGRSLDNFKFDLPLLQINTSQIFDLATCLFVEEKVNVLIVGPTGIGKSHIAQSIGQQACQQGHDVQFIGFAKAMAQLRAGRADGTYERKLQALVRPALLILDDFGLKPLSNQADEDFHEIVCERYERGSIIITSNLEFEEWGKIFPNPVLGAATVDRLRHQAHRVILDGPSHRKPKSLPTTPKAAKDTR